MAADVDLLHLHSNGLIVEVAAVWARRHRRPYVLTLYGTEIWHYRRRALVDPFTRAYHGAAEVTVYSQRLEQHARDVGLGRPALSVVYPAVSGEFTPADEPARAVARASLGIGEARIVLNVKRLHELAGQRFLVDAFARIASRRQDVRLIICGTGPLRGELEAQVARTGLTSLVTFTGLLPNHEVARYAAIADVFALPSLLEALPTVAVEALAAGTPVVSADHPGGQELHELFGEDVQLVPRADVGALAAALERRLEEPRRTTPATMRVIQARFSPAAVSQAYAAVYARVVERSTT
jgi:glycosyltransferase involved in cell wall biosynthesis